MHCSFCRRAGRVLVYEGESANACGACVLAVARFVTKAADATVREFWDVGPALPPGRPPAVTEAWEDEIVEDVQRDLDTGRVLDDFRAGVAAMVPEDDAATHYELGVAYCEMGLYEDAVREFEIARVGLPLARVADAEFLGAVTLQDAGRTFEAIRAAAAFIAARQRTDERIVAVLMQRLSTMNMQRIRESIFLGLRGFEWASASVDGPRDVDVSITASG